ncbi:DMSO/selenate family reductase complex A subunit [Enterobacter asburiae]|uniref:DMSO/selenate family reductase complex A subunit n=1 Tax=Enterobacter asburiae TaxID=61645 RepID=UPI003F42C6E2
MSDTEHHGGISRRTLVKSTAIGSLALAAGGISLPFGLKSAAAAVKNAVQPVEDKVVWGACSVNCGSRCALRLHVRDDEVYWVETDNTGEDIYGNHQVRACLRGRSIRRRINHPDRLNYPMKRVGKRGEGKFERITWDEALDAITASLKNVVSKYGNEAVYINYSSGIVGGNITRSSPYASLVARLMNCYGGFLSHYGTYSTAQIACAMPYTYGSNDGNSTSDIQNSKLVAGIAWVMIDENLVDQPFLDKYCVGYDEKTLPEGAPANGHYKAYILGQGDDRTAKTPEWASRITGIPADRIIKLAREIGSAKPAYICQGWGPQRQANGELTSRAIAMLPILTGNVGISGGNSGARESTYTITIERMPIPDNPVKTQISCFSWTDAIARGPEMTALRDGVRGKDKLDVPIKFIWNYAGNTIINQHSDINKTHDILQDESKCEMIVVIDNFMTSSAKYADIVLPDLMTVEQEDIIPNDYAGNMGYLIFLQPVTAPKFERKPIYWIMSEVAKRLGPDIHQKFTEGRTQEQWLQFLYAKMLAKDPQLPSYDELKKMGIYKRKDPNGHFVAYKKFRENPEANPLKTPSGKIEIYSSKLAEIAATWELAKDETISPLPVYASTFDGWDAPERTQFPLQLFGFHFKARTHSSYGNVDVLKAACRQEVWLNPVDAEKRGIKNGDTVRVFNSRGEVRIEAKVTPRIMPGVSAMGQGAWHDANMSGDRIDHGSCINTLTTHRPSPLAKGNPQHTNLVQIEKV